MKQYSYQRFRNQLILIAFIASILVLFAGYYYLKYEKSTLRQEKYNELLAISKLKTEQLVQWQKERLSEAAFFSRNFPCSIFAHELTEGNTENEVLFRNSRQ